MIYLKNSDEPLQCLHIVDDIYELYCEKGYEFGFYIGSTYMLNNLILAHGEGELISAKLYIQGTFYLGRFKYGIVSNETGIKIGEFENTRLTGYNCRHYKLNHLNEYYILVGTWFLGEEIEIKSYDITGKLCDYSSWNLVIRYIIGENYVCVTTSDSRGESSIKKKVLTKKEYLNDIIDPTIPKVIHDVNYVYNKKVADVLSTYLYKDLISITLSYL